MWLLDGIAGIPTTDARVADLTLDSRQARAGSLFFALPGRLTHGLGFAAQACARGASVVLWEPVPGAAAPALPGAFAAAVPGLSRLVGRIADRFFDWPSSQMRIVGVTGTNGKTTCAHMLAQCLEILGRPAAYLGTLGWGRLGALEKPTHTTPDVITLHRQLAAMRAAGVRDVAMEVSSHALDQDRIADVRFHAAAFTNLSRDHLDYHGSMRAYGEAKAKLFAVPGLQQIIVNVGDDFGRELVQRFSGRLPLTAVWVGAGASGWMAERTLHAAEPEFDRRGLAMRLQGSFGEAVLHARLIGRFNAENCLVVTACLLSMGVALPAAAAAIAACQAPPGRMEVIEAARSGRPLAVVDYAHTPDALSKALAALRGHCRGALWCVFGCGGDRDPGKRPMMGAVADELADQIILTDDNPRSEDPRAITAAIAGGISAHAARVIHDRGAAIGAALTEAAAVDVVLIAGKGHEEQQIYGATSREFSDRREAMRHLGVAA